ncbi:MAG: hypothetical protein WC877_00480 [Dehalococcoidales bacterium]|jgi:hypothetical protein
MDNKIICPKCNTELIDDDYDEMINYNHGTSVQEAHFCHNCKSYVKVEYNLTISEIWCDD